MMPTDEAQGRATEIEQLDTTAVLRDLSLALQRQEISRGAYTYGRHLVREYLNTNPEHRAFCGCFPAASTVVGSLTAAGFPASARSVSRWKGELEAAGIVSRGRRLWHKSDNLEFESLRSNALYEEGLERLYARVSGGSPTLARGGRQHWRGGVANIGDQTPGSNRTPLRKNSLGGEGRPGPTVSVVVGETKTDIRHHLDNNRGRMSAPDPGWSDEQCTRMAELLVILQEVTKKRHLGGNANRFLFDSGADDADLARLEELLSLEDERLRGGVRRLAVDPGWRVGHRMQTVRLWLEHAEQWVRGPVDWEAGERRWYRFLWSLLSSEEELAPGPQGFYEQLQMHYGQTSGQLAEFLKAELRTLVANGYVAGAPEPVELPERPGEDAPVYDRELWAHRILERLAPERACWPEPELDSVQDCRKVAAYYGVDSMIGDKLAEYAANLEAGLPEVPWAPGRYEAIQERQRCSKEAVRRRLQRLIAPQRPEVEWREVAPPKGYEAWADEHAELLAGSPAMEEVLEAEQIETAGPDLVAQTGADAECPQEGGAVALNEDSNGGFEPIEDDSPELSPVCRTEAEGQIEPPAFVRLTEGQIIERIRQVNIGLLEAVTRKEGEDLVEQSRRLLAELRESLAYRRRPAAHSGSSWTGCLDRAAA